MSRKRPKRAADVPSPTPPIINSRWVSMTVDGNKIVVPTENAHRIIAARGVGVRQRDGEEHENAFRDIVLDLWEDLAAIEVVSLPKAQQAAWRRWTAWTGLPVPGSHEVWNAVWHWAGLTPPDEITDERIKSDLKPALWAKHRRGNQDKQPQQNRNHWSRHRRVSDWIKTLNELGHKMSESTFLRRRTHRAKPAYRQNPDSTRESVSLWLADLPAGYDDNADT